MKLFSRKKSSKDLSLTSKKSTPTLSTSSSSTTAKSSTATNNTTTTTTAAKKKANKKKPSSRKKKSEKRSLLAASGSGAYTDDYDSHNDHGNDEDDENGGNSVRQRFQQDVSSSYSNTSSIYSQEDAAAAAAAEDTCEEDEDDDHEFSPERARPSKPKRRPTRRKHATPQDHEESTATEKGFAKFPLEGTTTTRTRSNNGSKRSLTRSRSASKQSDDAKKNEENYLNGTTSIPSSAVLQDTHQYSSQAHAHGHGRQGHKSKQAAAAAAGQPPQGSSGGASQTQNAFSPATNAKLDSMKRLRVLGQIHYAQAQLRNGNGDANTASVPSDMPRATDRRKTAKHGPNGKSTTKNQRFDFSSSAAVPPPSSTAHNYNNTNDGGESTATASTNTSDSMPSMSDDCDRSSSTMESGESGSIERYRDGGRRSARSRRHGRGGDRHGQQQESEEGVRKSRRRRRRDSSKRKVPAGLPLVRAALGRPFGRDYLPAMAKRWTVEIDAPGWDAHEQQWYYEIAITTNNPNTPHNPTSNSDDDDDDDEDVIPLQDGFRTTRSLKDLLWLEESLIYEFSGSLLLPNMASYIAASKAAAAATMEGGTSVDDGLSLAGTSVGGSGGGSSGTLSQNLVGPDGKVDSLAVQHWFSDILNGVRGEGELLLPRSWSKDLLKSEAMETFLYQNGALPPPPPPPPQPAAWGHAGGSPGQGMTMAHAPWENAHALEGGASPAGMMDRGAGAGGRRRFPADSLMKSLVGRGVFACIDPSAAQRNTVDGTGGASPDGNYQRRTATLPIEIFPTCSSRAMVGGGGPPPMGDGRHGGGVVGGPQTPRSPTGGNFAGMMTPGSSPLAIHSDLIEAYRLYSRNYQKKVLPKCRKKIKSLLHYENLEGAAWKRFAISLSNLFALERDIQESKVSPHAASSEKKDPKTNHPLRRLKRSEVEDGLRLLARQKVDRGVLSLQSLQVMMSSFQRDVVGAIPRSLDAYLRCASERLAASPAGARRSSSSLAEGAPLDSSNASVGGSTVESAERMKQYVYHVAAQKFDSMKKQLYPSPGGQHHHPPSSPVFSSPPPDDFTTTSSGSLEARQRNDILCKRVIQNERRLRSSLKALCAATPLRMARMSWTYFKMEASQASLLSSASISIRTKVATPEAAAYAKALQERHRAASVVDDDLEVKLVQRILELTSSADDEEEDEDEDIVEKKRRDGILLRAMQLARARVGRWDAKMALTVMEAAGIQDAEVRVEETTRDLRLIRKYAIGLRECVERCEEALNSVMAVIRGEPDAAEQHGEASIPSSAKKNLRISEARQEFFVAAAVLFSGVLAEDVNDKLRQANEPHTVTKPSSSSPSKRVLSSAAIDTSDPAGWLDALALIQGNLATAPLKKEDKYRLGNCGKVASGYLKVRQTNVLNFLSQANKFLREYERRVEVMESYVYMQCVGIQLEKHFSKSRADALAAWEKKTDITTAINIATKKRLPKLVKELEAKLDTLSSSVSHTGVKQAKERHLASKGLKAELQSLADRRFQRSKEEATERVTRLIGLWAEQEEAAATEELKVLGETIREIERTVTKETIDADGGAHLFSTAATTFNKLSK